MVMMHNWIPSIDGKGGLQSSELYVLLPRHFFLQKDSYRKLQYAPWIVGHRRWSLKYQVAEFRSSSKAGADPRMPFGLWVTTV